MSDGIGLYALFANREPSERGAMSDVHERLEALCAKAVNYATGSGEFGELAAAIDALAAEFDAAVALAEASLSWDDWHRGNDLGRGTKLGKVHSAALASYRAAKASP